MLLSDNISASSHLWLSSSVSFLVHQRIEGRKKVGMIVGEGGETRKGGRMTDGGEKELREYGSIQKEIMLASNESPFASLILLLLYG